MKYKISIIIPVYNAEKYIVECFESIQNQTIGFENLQIIFINDGSTDNCRTILDKFSEKYANVKVVHLEKSHVIGGFARNEGIKHAIGEYMMFLDSDDCYAPNGCKIMYDTAFKNNADVVTANYKCMNQTGEIFQDSMFDKEKYKSGELKEINEKFFYLYCPSACIKIFNTKLIKENEIEFLDGVPGEDAFFTTKAFVNSNKIYYVSEEIYYYRRRDVDDKSTSWMRNRKYFLGLDFSFKKIYETFAQNDKVNEYRYFYAKNFISIIYKFIDSKLITNEERIELANTMYWFFEQSKILDIKFPQKSLMILLDYILSKDYENMIKVCEVIEENRTYLTAIEKDKMSKPEKIIVEES